MTLTITAIFRKLSTMLVKRLKRNHVEGVVFIVKNEFKERDVPVCAILLCRLQRKE